MPAMGKEKTRRTSKEHAPSAEKASAPKPLSEKASAPKPLSEKASAPKPLSEKASAPKPLSSEAAASSFSELGLRDWLLVSCREMGLVRPTPVQCACIPAVLRGEDVLGTAQTGSGKTAAFALPILQKLAEDPFGVFALVLTPTRELAFQIADQFRALGAAVAGRTAVVVGGLAMGAQAQALRGRPHVVVATPGRLHDILRTDIDCAKAFARTQFLVLDEADRLFESGFAEQLSTIMGALPRQRQTLLFSATMTSDLEALQLLAEEGGRPTFSFRAYEGLQTVQSLQQEYLFVPSDVKDMYLVHIAKSLVEWKVRSAIIFTQSCRSCHFLHAFLEEQEVPCTPLHSMLAQTKRMASLARFKSSQVPLLIATDVASRGLDIPTVDLVVNYDVPRQPQDYVHRVGRTARAGRGGRAITLVTQYDVELVHEIEQLIDHKLVECPLDEKEVLKDITKVFKGKHLTMLRIAEGDFEERSQQRKKRRREARESMVPKP